MNNPRILILKLGAIGDVVLSLPMFQALRAEFPNAQITLMIGKTAAPLLENNSVIDKVWIVDENIFWQMRGISLMRLWWAVRKHRFDQVYILQWSSLFHLFFWLAGIPERIGFSREGNAFRLTRQIPYFEGDAAYHDVDLYQSLVKSENRPAFLPRLILTARERSDAEAVWTSLGVQQGQPRIVMAPGGGHNAKLVMPLKRWPVTHYAGLAQKLKKEPNALIVLVGSPEEKTLLDAVGLPAERNFAGRISLRATAALIATSHLFVGNDSGLTHIAYAVGTRSVAFFGPTSPHGKEARGTPQQILYRNESCSPCYRFGSAPPCPYQVKCLTQISIEEAWRAILTLETVPMP